MIATHNQAVDVRWAPRVLAVTDGNEHAARRGGRIPIWTVD